MDGLAPPACYRHLGRLPAVRGLLLPLLPLLSTSLLLPLALLSTTSRAAQQQALAQGIALVLGDVFHRQGPFRPRAGAAVASGQIVRAVR
jgi:hypothetical protein